MGGCDLHRSYILLAALRDVSLTKLCDLPHSGAHRLSTIHGESLGASMLKDIPTRSASFMLKS